MGKKLETATNGRISIQMYPSMQLGGEKEMIEQAQVGALQIARISVGAMGPVVDDLNVFNLPFIFRDEAHMRKVIDGPIGAELLEKINSNPASRIVALGWMDAGVRNVYGKKPVPTPADLKGQKIRMMGNPIFVETMNAMGGSGVAMGFNELYAALETGVVDGAENNPPTLLAQNHYLVSKVYTLTGHLIIPEIFIFSKRTWDGLSPDDQALLKKLSREAQFEQRKLWDEKTVTAEADLKAKGVTFVPADKAAYYKATQPIRDKYGVKYAALAEANRRDQVSAPMKAAYAAAMERLYLACIVVSAVALVAITLVIPYGVFMRYVMNSASSWPEPFSVLAMVLFSFVGGAAAYRANVHIAVQMLTDAVPAPARRALLLLADLAMVATALFMMVYGTQLVRATWNQTIAEFPTLSVGITYLPIPVGGLFTLLFIVERLWLGMPPPTSVMYRDQPLAE